VGKPADGEHLVERVRRLLDERTRAGGEGISFLGERFNVTADPARIMRLLLWTFEDAVRKNQELSVARDELLAKNAELLRVERQKEELAALLVHDLKGPAAGIMMLAQSYLRRRDLGESDREPWRHVFAAGEIVNRMVLNLLDIARSEDGVFAPRESDVDLAGLIGHVQQLMAPLADGRRQTVVADVPPGLPLLRGDLDLLRRVLQNLVDNALRHSVAGQAVRIEAEATADGVLLRVRDQGSGIPPELRERVFDKYFRVDRSVTDDHVGKGLGLAFCRRAVETHGGRIWVEESAPRGSVFVVKLPRR
jgi:signal transduction histidine kinase